MLCTESGNKFESWFDSGIKGVPCLVVSISVTAVGETVVCEGIFPKRIHVKGSNVYSQVMLQSVHSTI
jgi:hypothetical protein